MSQPLENARVSTVKIIMLNFETNGDNLLDRGAIFRLLKAHAIVDAL